MTNELLQTALGLPPEERVELADRLLRSVETEDGDDRTEVEAAWAEEIERRIKSMDEGRTPSIPWDEAVASIKRRFGWDLDK